MPNCSDRLRLITCQTSKGEVLTGSNACLNKSMAKHMCTKPVRGTHMSCLQKLFVNPPTLQRSSVLGLRQFTSCDVASSFLFVFSLQSLSLAFVSIFFFLVLLLLILLFPLLLPCHSFSSHWSSSSSSSSCSF